MCPREKEPQTQVQNTWTRLTDIKNCLPNLIIYFILFPMIPFTPLLPIWMEWLWTDGFINSCLIGSVPLSDHVMVFRTDPSSHIKRQRKPTLGQLLFDQKWYTIQSHQSKFTKPSVTSHPYQ